MENRKELIKAIKLAIKESSERSKSVSKDKAKAKSEITDKAAEAYQENMCRLSYQRYKARREGRIAHLAYGFVRNIPYVVLESKVNDPNELWYL